MSDNKNSQSKDLSSVTSNLQDLLGSLRAITQDIQNQRPINPAQAASVTEAIDSIHQINSDLIQRVTKNEYRINILLRTITQLESKHLEVSKLISDAYACCSCGGDESHAACICIAGECECCECKDDSESKATKSGGCCSTNKQPKSSNINKCACSVSQSMQQMSVSPVSTCCGGNCACTPGSYRCKCKGLGNPQLMSRMPVSIDCCGGQCMCVQSGPNCGCQGPVQSTCCGGLCKCTSTLNRCGCMGRGNVSNQLPTMMMGGRGNVPMMMGRMPVSVDCCGSKCYCSLANDNCGCQGLFKQASRPVSVDCCGSACFCTYANDHCGCQGTKKQPNIKLANIKSTCCSGACMCSTTSNKCGCAGVDKKVDVAADCCSGACDCSSKNDVCGCQSAPPSPKKSSPKNV